MDMQPNERGVDDVWREERDIDDVWPEARGADDFWPEARDADAESDWPAYSNPTLPNSGGGGRAAEFLGRAASMNREAHAIDGEALIRMLQEEVPDMRANLDVMEGSRAVDGLAMERGVAE